MHMKSILALGKAKATRQLPAAFPRFRLVFDIIYTLGLVPSIGINHIQLCFIYTREIHKTPKS